MSGKGIGVDLRLRCRLGDAPAPHVAMHFSGMKFSRLLSAFSPTRAMPSHLAERSEDILLQGQHIQSILGDLAGSGLSLREDIVPIVGRDRKGQEGQEAEDPADGGGMRR